MHYLKDKENSLHVVVSIRVLAIVQSRDSRTKSFSIPQTEVSKRRELKKSLQTFLQQSFRLSWDILIFLQSKNEWQVQNSLTK